MELPARPGMMTTLRTVDAVIPPLLLLLFNVVPVKEEEELEEDESVAGQESGWRVSHHELDRHGRPEKKCSSFESELLVLLDIPGYRSC